MKRTPLKRKKPLRQRTPLRRKAKKPKRTGREIDELFLAFIRRQSCAVPLCGKLAEPHHLKTRGAGGSDLTCIPLCRYHHMDVHNIGTKRFNEKHNVDLWRINEIMLDKYR